MLNATVKAVSYSSFGTPENLRQVVSKVQKLIVWLCDIGALD
jgi:hypothetical protein